MKRIRNRSLRLESLEERMLLAVTGGGVSAAELAAPIDAVGFESESPSLMVTTLDDVVDQTDGLISLREAVSYAETLTGAASVTFADRLEGTIVLANGEISINSASGITIDGRNLITIDAGGAGRAFKVEAGKATINGFSMADRARATELAKAIVAFRTEQTVAAIARAIANKGTLPAPPR